MAAKAADTAAQWDHTIVRFPEGAGWNDLLNRKTPGWEEWKQLGILKDGKFRPQAAIKQAKLLLSYNPRYPYDKKGTWGYFICVVVRTFTSAMH